MSIIADLRNNSPFKNICLGYFGSLFLFVLIVMLFHGLSGFWAIVVPFFAMTLGIYLLFWDFGEYYPFEFLYTLRILFGITLLAVGFGWYYRKNLWGQALVVIGLWAWAMLGVFGAGLHY